MIHKFEFDGTKIVLDVHSGSVHVVDDLTWELLDHYQTHSLLDIKRILENQFEAVEIEEAWGEIEVLAKLGQLFSADCGLNGYRFPEKPIVKSLCLHIAHDCNLRCQYCFAGSGHFGGDRTLMSLETGQKAIDFLIQASGARKNIEIDFFGGEPLLNFQVVKDLVNYGEERALATGKVFKFTLTTNAVLLDEFVQKWLNEKGISVVLSLDGRKTVNDQMRTYIDGSGCYDDIVMNISRFVKSRDNQNYYVRGTFTHENLDFTKDIMHMVELGFNEVSVEPVVAPEEEEYALKKEDIPTLQEEYGKLTRAYLEKYKKGNPFNFFHFNLDLSGGPCLPKRLSGCGAGHEYLAVSPEGKMYPCHQFVGKSEFLIGDVDNGIQNMSLMKEFQNAHVYNKEKCKNCWAKFYCSGGCHANAMAANEDLLVPYDIGCELEKKRLECAIYLQVAKVGL